MLMTVNQRVAGSSLDHCLVALPLEHQQGGDYECF